MKSQIDEIRENFIIVWKFFLDLFYNKNKKNDYRSISMEYTFINVFKTHY